MNKWQKRTIAAAGVAAAITTTYQFSKPPEVTPLKLVKVCKEVVIPALLVLGIGAAITGCKDGGSKALPLIDTNDHLTESNELQDQTLKMGLAKKFGTPLAYGATLGKRGVRDDDWSKMLKMEGISTPVVKGAPRRGLNQGHSPLSNLIVQSAKKYPKLTVTIGGKWTDTALAVKHNPEICPKLRVIGIGGSNISDTEGRREYAQVAKCVKNLTVIDKNGYKDLIIKHCSTTWLNKNVKTKKVGAHVYASHGVNWVAEAKMLNRGQFKVDSICRIADFKATGWGMAGKISDAQLMQFAAEGLAKLP